MVGEISMADRTWIVEVDDVFIDSAYTERFMGMPEVEDNWKGYENADVSKQANRFLKRKSKFFLIHGTSDENVHLQHSMLLTKTLVEENVQFRQMVRIALVWPGTYVRSTTSIRSVPQPNRTLFWPLMLAPPQGHSLNVEIGRRHHHQ